MLLLDDVFSESCNVVCQQVVQREKWLMKGTRIDMKEALKNGEKC